jgi:hypothetical protein
MLRLSAVLLLLCCASCCGSRELSPAERSKLTPGLLALLTDETAPDGLFDSSVRTDGTKEYSVIIRSTSADELRSKGIRVQSVIGDIVTAQVSKEELRSLLSLASVRSVDQGSRNQPNR